MSTIIWNCRFGCEEEDNSWQQDIKVEKGDEKNLLLHAHSRGQRDKGEPETTKRKSECVEGRTKLQRAMAPPNIGDYKSRTKKLCTK
jgi:hypothetical protein